jgi:hypothetical protein
LWPAFTSIVVDENDDVHICYNDTRRGALKYDLKYATNTSGSWIYYPVDRFQTFGMDNSMAIDSAGYVHIAYLGESALWQAVFPKDQ